MEKKSRKTIHFKKILNNSYFVVSLCEALLFIVIIGIIIRYSLRTLKIVKTALE